MTSHIIADVNLKGKKPISPFRFQKGGVYLMECSAEASGNVYGIGTVPKTFHI